jgi:hypothetical protein
MEHDDLEMDESGLKGAIQRAWGNERVPQRVRGRISHLIATAASVDLPAQAAASAWDRWSGRVYGLVAAAVLLFGIGSLVMYYQGFFDSPAFARYDEPAPPPTPMKTPVPITIARSMIATHTACGMLDHHVVDVTVERNYAALGVKLTADLGFPALSRGLGPEWTFQGAAECIVAGQQASHLLFTRGDATISIYSLPLHCTELAAGSEFEGMLDGQPVAGFARPGALYGVVGSGPAGTMSLETVTAIRDALLSQFQPGECVPGEDMLDF